MLNWFIYKEFVGSFNFPFCVTVYTKPRGVNKTNRKPRDTYGVLRG